MTLRDVRDPAKLIADWCLNRDDLLGFHVEIRGAENTAWLHVYLVWLNGWVNSRIFSLPELEVLHKVGAVMNILEKMATDAVPQERSVVVFDRSPG